MQAVFLKWLMGLALVLGVAASGFAQQSPGGAAAAQPEHILGPGDVLKISVYQNPDLTTEGRLSETGALTFPLLGSIDLGGLTTQGAEHKIAKLLRDGKFVNKPQVMVLLSEIRSTQISIIGQVAKPGRYPIDSSTSKVSEMIAAAGGVLPTGDDVVTLAGTRNGKPIKMDIDLPTIYQAGNSDLDVRVQSGDIIYVHKAPQYYIYGEVQRPGVYKLERGTTLLKALAQAGGLTLRGTDKGIKLHRRDDHGVVKITEPKMSDLLEPEDVLYVRESLF